MSSYWCDFISSHSYLRISIVDFIISLVSHGTKKPRNNIGQFLYDSVSVVYKINWVWDDTSSLLFESAQFILTSVKEFYHQKIGDLVVWRLEDLTSFRINDPLQIRWLLLFLFRKKKISFFLLHIQISQLSLLFTRWLKNRPDVLKNCPKCRAYTCI